MACLELVLFGGFQARAAGQPIDVPGRKERALLAILAMPPGEPRSRDKLAGLLWSDRADKQAHDSLKQAVLRLRKSFGSLHPLPVLADRDSLTLDRAEVAVDVQEFEQLFGEGTPDAVARATTLYRGDLLDGLDVRDPAFEEWLLFERQRLRDLARQGLARLLDRHIASGAHDEAGAVARRLLALDPLREVAHRALMQIYAEQGQTALALRQYQICRDGLRGELGVRPEAETERLYEAIRQRRAAPAPPAAGAVAIEVVDRPKPLPIESPESTSTTPLPLPSKPSIAVLPFQNLSGDPEQEYFADGMVEEIITALSRMRWLFVIARNSSFTYKGRAVDVKQVGRELGVRYVLEGSVRKAGNEVRITGELIDTSTGANIWVDHFDGVLDDIFELQDRVTASVVGALAPKLEQAEIERAKRKPTGSMDAYDYFLRGMAGYHRWTREGSNEALSQFYRAIELDPDFASAYGMTARCYSQRKTRGWVTDRLQEIAETERLVRRAAELGKDDAVALCAAGIALAFVVGDVDDGAALIDRALVLNPNLAQAWVYSGWVKVWLGEPEVAIERVTHGMRLSPHDPHVFHGAIACAHFIAGRYAEALSWAGTSLRERPNSVISACMLAASSALAGRLAEAQKAMARLRQLDPALRISNLQDRFPIQRSEDLARWVEGLRIAGLPE